ncbi:hypothetical protein ACFQT0_08815 [Hymenobacter humi]|uniref:Uncharacterized protein n=1 Tax=Hymenobacter humi TaxID=1411620 RepID=A0ABW2U530_9BACT
MKRILLMVMLWTGSTMAMQAQALIDPKLQEAVASGTGIHQVIVTFQGSGLPRPRRCKP